LHPPPVGGKLLQPTRSSLLLPLLLLEIPLLTAGIRPSPTSSLQQWRQGDHHEARDASHMDDELRRHFSGKPPSLSVSSLSLNKISLMVQFSSLVYQISLGTTCRSTVYR
jgi:hypothetical protein